MVRGLVIVSLLAAIALAWQFSRVGDFESLWLTPDQQAQRTYEALEFQQAYDKFEDPARKGVAAYDSGLYEESAAAFGRIATAEGFYNRGNAFMKGRDYGKAIVAYEQAVADAPDWTEAQENLDLAIYTLEYIERVREQSDTGDERLPAYRLPARGDSRGSTFMMRILPLVMITLAISGEALAQEQPIVRVQVTPNSASVGEAAELTVTVLVPTWFTRPPVYPSFELANASAMSLGRASSGPTRSTR